MICKKLCVHCRSFYLFTVFLCETSLTLIYLVKIHVKYSMLCMQQWFVFIYILYPVNYSGLFQPKSLSRWLFKFFFWVLFLCEPQFKFKLLLQLILDIKLNQQHRQSLKLDLISSLSSSVCIKILHQPMSNDFIKCRSLITTEFNTNLYHGSFFFHVIVKKSLKMS